MKRFTIYLKPLLFFGLSACSSMIRSSSSNLSLKKEMADPGTDIPESVLGAAGNVPPGMLITKPRTLFVPAKGKYADAWIFTLRTIRDPHFRNLLAIKDRHQDSATGSSNSCECVPFSQPHLHPEGEKFGKNPSWRDLQYGWLGRKSFRRRFTALDLLRRLHTLGMH